jgi:1,2-dihydroxy-3-keto-5-methylthiopentene dioxygenase
VSRLTIYLDDNPRAAVLDTTDCATIQDQLRAIEVRFERWDAAQQLAREATDADVLRAYAHHIERITREAGYQTVDVLRVNRDTPDKPAVRSKFLDEHTHSENEVRFFVEGEGVFYLRTAGKVYMTLCERGDLISVPAGTRHWFDMGPDPQITAIRFFDNKEGWVPHFTGSSIAAAFPKFE